MNTTLENADEWIRQVRSEGAHVIHVPPPTTTIESLGNEISRLKAEKAMLREALAEIVGVSSAIELDAMEATIATIPDCDNKRISLKAIQALKATTP